MAFCETAALRGRYANETVARRADLDLHFEETQVVCEPLSLVEKRQELRCGRVETMFEEWIHHIQNNSSPLFTCCEVISATKDSIRLTSRHCDWGVSKLGSLTVCCTRWVLIFNQFSQSSESGLKIWVCYHILFGILARIHGYQGCALFVSLLLLFDRVVEWFIVILRILKINNRKTLIKQKHSVLVLRKRTRKSLVLLFVLLLFCF